MSDESDKSVNMQKKTGRPAAGTGGAKAGATPTVDPATRPTSVVALTVAMLLAGVLAVFAGLALFGHQDYLRDNITKNAPPVTAALAEKAGAASAESLTKGLKTGATLSASQITTRADAVADAIDTALPGKYTSSDQLKDQQKKARAAVTKSLGDISGPVTAAQVTTVSQATSATVEKNLTTLSRTQAKDIRDRADSLPKTQAIAGVVLLVALGFVAFGAYAGRYWARWGVPVIWILCSFTGTTAGLYSLLQVGSDAPLLYRTVSAIASAALIAAVVLTFLRPSRAWFDAHKPVAAAGAPARRGLFAPRVPPPSARTSTRATPASPSRTAPRTGRTDSAGTAPSKPAGPSAARAKKRAGDVTAPPATASRPRTTSKSRRTES